MSLRYTLCEVRDGVWGSSGRETRGRGEGQKAEAGKIALSHLCSWRMMQHPHKLQHCHEDGHQQTTHKHHEDPTNVLHAQTYTEIHNMIKVL